jgi:hypothetical protein
MLKIFGFSVGGVLVVLVAYIGLLFYPTIFFANHTEYGSLSVHSDVDFGNEIQPILRDIQAALVTSEIYDPGLKHDIFFGYGNSAFEAIQGIRAQFVKWTIGRRAALTYNASLPPLVSHIVTFRIPDFEANVLIHPERRAGIDLRQTLTHEVVHTLLMARLGSQAVVRYPMWKLEGYADYVAASTTTFTDTSYEIRDSVERILNEDLSWMMDAEGNFTRMRYSCQRMSSIETQQGLVWPTCYYISRVLWEYLLDVKGLTFDDVMSPEVTDTDTLAELVAAYQAGDLG